MSTTTKSGPAQASPIGDRMSLPALIAIAVALAFLKAAFAGAPLDTLIAGDNDDILRFLSVRDWLAGQSWFDMHQYRMVPPDGIDLHWSRYVDAGIAALAALLDIVSAGSGLGAAALIWPALLFSTLIAWTGILSRRLFGTRAAALAVVMLWLWPILPNGYFAPGRIDHHNVQILAVSGMLGALLWPSRGALTGITAGLCGAVALAVGLEQLPAILLGGVILLMATILERPGGRARLAGFCLGLPVGSALLFAGQVPAAEWAVPHCDELAPPILAGIGAASVVGLVAALARPRLSLRTSTLLSVLMSGAALALLWPLVGPCAEGPYGVLPADARQVISERISEARPALDTLMSGSGTGLVTVLPAATTTLIATTLWFWRWTTRRVMTYELRRVAVLLAFAWLGLIASLSQTRLIVMAVPAIPLLVGYAVSCMLSVPYGQKRSRGASLGAVGVLVATAFAPYVAFMLKAQIAPGSASVQTLDSACRDRASLESLVSLPTSTIFAPSNLSVPILLLTEHSVLTGPYHRSPAAMTDGLLPFEAPEQGFRDAIARLEPDYIAICREGEYGAKSFATMLADGHLAPGFAPVSGVSSDLVVLRVD